MFIVATREDLEVHSSVAIRCHNLFQPTPITILDPRAEKYVSITLNLE
jgi:hypothetical protein